MTPAADYYDEMPEPAAAPVTTIRPPRGWAPLDLREFTGAHELLYFLVLRNLKLRYKQTVLGAAWAVLQPLLTMAVFTVVFGRLARLGSDGLPYPVFALAALVPWTYFANALTQASTSLVDQHQLLTKVYFPRLLLPLAAVIAGLVDLVISFVVLLVVLAWYGITPSGQAAGRARLRPAGGRAPRSRRASGSRRSTCAIATCATSFRSSCRSGSSRRRWRIPAASSRSAGEPCTA